MTSRGYSKEGLVVLLKRKGVYVAGMTHQQMADLYESICGPQSYEYPPTPPARSVLPVSQIAGPQKAAAAEKSRMSILYSSLKELFYHLGRGVSVTFGLFFVVFVIAWLIGFTDNETWKKGAQEAPRWAPLILFSCPVWVFLSFVNRQADLR